jgi:hypothetical protein
MKSNFSNRWRLIKCNSFLSAFPVGSQINLWFCAHNRIYFCQNVFHADGNQSNYFQRDGLFWQNAHKRRSLLLWKIKIDFSQTYWTDCYVILFNPRYFVFKFCVITIETLIFWIIFLIKVLKKLNKNILPIISTRFNTRTNLKQFSISFKI